MPLLCNPITQRLQVSDNGGKHEFLSVSVRGQKVVRTVALGSALRRNAAKTDALRESQGTGERQQVTRSDADNRVDQGQRSGSFVRSRLLSQRVSVAVKGHVATRGEVEDTGGGYFEHCLG